ncbi:unnamed protein product, partial [Rotaria socialis]
NILITDHLVSNETIRHPLKPRIMSQAPIQIVETNESSCHDDVTIVQERKILKIYDANYW